MLRSMEAKKTPRLALDPAPRPIFDVTVGKVTYLGVNGVCAKALISKAQAAKILYTVAVRKAGV